MKNENDLRELTLYKFLESFIGQEKTSELVNSLQDAIDKNLSGEELEKLIRDEITRLKITDPCAREIILRFPFVIPKNEAQK